MPKKRPYNKSTGRNYRSDYDKFQSSTKAKKDRASRNKARREALREGRVKKGDGKDIAHKNSSPRDNRKSNLQVQDRSVNRGRRGEGGRKKKK